MDSNNCKFIKNISWEQTPMRIHDHSHHQTNTNMFPFQEFTLPNNLLQENRYQSCETMMKHAIMNEEKGEGDEDLRGMKETMFIMAAMQPVEIDPQTIRKRSRRNVRISTDPQSVAARRRREKIREKIRILQLLVPGGTTMDTASMLDQAICYVKYLKRRIRHLQANHPPPPPPRTPPPIGSFKGHAGCSFTGTGSRGTKRSHDPFS